MLEIVTVAYKLRQEVEPSRKKNQFENGRTKYTNY